MGKFFVNLLLLAVLVAPMTVQAACGPNNCYPSACQVATPLIYDFIFLIDTSVSMDNKIAGVTSGLSAFVDKIRTSVDGRYGVAVFHNSASPQMQRDLTDYSTFKTVMSALPSQTSGGVEDSLETLRASVNDWMNGGSYCSYGTCYNRNLNFSFRANSKVVIFVLTDEDSDPDNLPDSRFTGPTYPGSDNYCQGDSFAPEVAFTSQSLINKLGSRFAGLYLLVPSSFSGSSTCNTPYQFGDPNLQVQNSDFTGFDAAATMGKINQKSMQYYLLSRGYRCRVFDVLQTTNSVWIANFFTLVANEVSACDSCMSYPCSGASCLDPVNICDCAGTPYGTKTLDCAGTCGGKAVVDCAGSCGGTSALNHCNVCTVGGADTGCLQDCGGKYYLSGSTPTYSTDQCGQCYLTSGTKPYCQQDCTGAWRTSSSQMYTQMCSGCKPPGTTLVVVDDCGVCGGLNAAKNQCGVCFGSTALDNCGQAACKQLSCVKNCDNSYTTTLTKSLDECGNCVAVGTRDSRCVTDCAGSYYMNTGNPPYAYDNCHNCLPYGTMSASCVQDCNGVWGGSAYLDNCQQCITSTPLSCKKDCRGQWVGVSGPVYVVDSCGDCVLSGTPPAVDDCGVCHGGNAAKNECGTCFGVRGNDTCNHFICLNLSCSTDCFGNNVQTVTAHLDHCGHCRYDNDPDPTCLIDCNGNYYNTPNTPQYSLDPCGVCTLGGSPNGKCVQDCSGAWGGNKVLNNCNVCIDPTNPPFCQADCRPQYVSSAAAMYFTDACGYCVAPSTNTNAHKDDCGVCDGKNANKNACGVCFGSTALDLCGNAACFNLPCSQNCDGNYEQVISKHTDACGNCVSNSITNDPTCVPDCAGVYYTQGQPAPHVSTYNTCYLCVDAGTVPASCIPDCNGTLYDANTHTPPSIVDNCNRCVVADAQDGNCVTDCAGQYYLMPASSPHLVDSCGACILRADDGITLDSCGVCMNSASYISSWCVQDCDGVYRYLDPKSPIRPVVDTCSHCVNVTDFNNLMDFCGVCHDSVDSTWNQDLVKDTNGDPYVDPNGNMCGCFSSTTACDGVAYCLQDGDTCPQDCVRDACGRCPDSPSYNMIDDCGICCTGSDCNADKDSCGKCFGFDIDVQACGCNDATSCLDCAGVPNGKAQEDCAGVCNGHSICGVCGNGKVETGEQCDSIDRKVCTVDCLLVTEVSHLKRNLGIGLGVTAAAIILAAAAALAYLYAVKNGLFGQSSTKVDFGAQNDNPLYEEVGGTVDNPLYERGGN